MTMVNAFSADDFARLSPDEQKLIERREKVMGPA